MGLILDLSPRTLEKVLYFANYIVLDAGDTKLQYKQVLTEKEYQDAREEFGNSFRAGMGAESIKELLMAIDLEKESAELKAGLKDSTGQKRARIIKRLEVVEAFRESGNRPEWMILDAVPVIPPDLRPMVQLDGGRFATSDLNDLFRNKTALQNVTEGLIVARKLPKEQADEIGMKMLAKVGLADRADYYPRQLSGGQQQRVAIARALAADPEIIYFDEPTSALDPELTGEVLSVMRQLAEEGMTMLVVTHEMGFARNVSSKTVFMENGVVVEQAPSQQFFASPKEERTRAFLRRIAHTE